MPTRKREFKAGIKCDNCGKQISYNTPYKTHKAYLYAGKNLCFDCKFTLQARGVR